MITPGNPNPPLPSPGAQVCIPVTSTAGGALSVTVVHEDGSSETPPLTLLPDPPNTYVVCFTWPAGNLVSMVSVAIGNDTVSFSVVGAGES